MRPAALPLALAATLSLGACAVPPPVPACVTVTDWLAIVIVPERPELLVLAPIESVTDPFPLPLKPD